VAMNMPLQGTAADIMKIAMINLHRELTATGLPAKMLLQVHDELVVETGKSDVKQVAELVKSTMEAAAALSVPLTVEAAWGPNWNNLTDLDLD